MIGSHNTFTYLESAIPLFNLCKRWWKCQTKPLLWQYAYGIRFFDIRVCRDKGLWKLCHGLVDLKDDSTMFTKIISLEDICKAMAKMCPEAIYRIVLEKGNSTDEMIFIMETCNLCKQYPNLWRLDIKNDQIWNGKYGNNNQLLYDKGYKFAKVNTWEEPSHELRGNITKDNWYKTSLKGEAKTINSNLDFFKDNYRLEQMIASKEELYLLDFCTDEY